MTRSNTMELIEKAKARGADAISTQGRSEWAPYLKIISDSNEKQERLPALTYDSLGRGEDFWWIEHARKARRDPVSVFARADDQHPFAVAVPPGERGGECTVVDTAGKVILTAQLDRTAALWFTRWSVTDETGKHRWTLTERPADALWRRTLGFPSRTNLWGLEAVSMVLALPSLFRSRAVLRIRDANANPLGQVTFSAGILKPRENFDLTVSSAMLPDDKQALALATIAVIQRMR